MLRTRSPFILALPLFLACEAGDVGDADFGTEMAPTGQPAVTVDAAASEAEVSRIRDGWVQAAEAGDVATIASYYAEDARMVDVTGEVFEGREAIQETLTTGLEGMSDLEVTSTDLVVGTDVVSDMGSFTQTFQTPDGQEQTVSGRYIVVLRRQDDGSWKIVQHLASAPQEPAAGNM
ncbi:MAG: YybH family protein [Longimicrobiales bacterium]